MKYKLKQLVYFLMENKIHSAPILCRKCVENENEKGLVYFGASGITYATCHGEIPEESVYPSEKALKDSL